MDVINRGDFAITNFEGKTKMSFRVPSGVETDYVKQAQVRKATHARARPIEARPRKPKKR
jgi:hypothetical protein